MSFCLTNAHDEKFWAFVLPQYIFSLSLFHHVMLVVEIEFDVFGGKIEGVDYKIFDGGFVQFGTHADGEDFRGDMEVHATAGNVLVFA